MLRRLGNFVRARVLLVLAMLALGVVALRLSGLPLEDAQTILFPLLLVAFWKLPKDKFARVPVLIVVLIFVAWATSALRIRGYFDDGLFDSGVYIARLRDDPDGSRAREFYRRYSEVARAYSLPKAKMLQREFVDETAARKWLRQKNRATLLVHGDPDWLEVSLQLSFMGDRTKVSLAQESDSFILTGPPHSFKLPREPEEVSRHFLAWLVRGLVVTDLMGDRTPIQSQAIQLDALSQASHILGPWFSNEPLPLANYLLGTSSLLFSVDVVSGDPSNADFQTLQCALDYFGKATQYLPRVEAPELYAMIFNNAAVARLLRSQRPKDLWTAMRWLKESASTFNADGTATEAAIVALHNIEVFERTWGLID